MRTLTISFVLALCAAATGLAQDRRPGLAPIDLGPDVTEYQRFVVYPHLQRGLSLLQRGRWADALKELERARELAPRNATVAVYLAEAHRKAGRSDRAAAVLRQQLRITPADRNVRATLSAIEPDRSAAAEPPLAGRAPLPGARASSTSVAPRPRAAVRERSRGSMPPAVPSPPEPIAASADEPPQRFALALAERRFGDAARVAGTLVGAGEDVAVLDEVTYRLAEAGATAEAVRLLLEVFPFANAPLQQREQLLDRLVLLLTSESRPDDSVDLASLREPLDAPSLRRRQGVLWEALADCAAVRAVLGDVSPDYEYEDLLRLGDCSAADEPLQAQRAYALAEAMQPGGRASLELAYQAFANRDYPAALNAWRNVGRQQMTPDHWLAAATTAVDGSDPAQAESWLNEYRAAGGPADYPYWSILASAHEARGNTASARAALEQASALQPTLSDHLRLARMSDEPQRRVYWLERATAHSGAGADVYLELAYAYQQAGRLAETERALERAVSLDPQHLTAQLELGYAYWRSRKFERAAQSLEQAWQTDPDNLAAALQLVYVNQRLSQNTDARFYAERALDALSREPSTVERAEQIFGLRRLHEDLGRRLTVAFDGWSGTQVGTATIGADPGARYRSYAQAEVDYRLGSPAIRNGRTVSAYLRVFGDGGGTSTTAPIRNGRVGVGVRWKPFTNQILYLAAERQQSLTGATPQDVLLRSSASLLNGGRHSDDWHSSGPMWMAYNLFVDVAHYLRSAQSSATADFRASTHIKVGPRQTLEPHVRLQASGFRVQRVDHDIRLGIGSRWNMWHGGSLYDADPHKLSLGIEYQHPIDTRFPSGRGVFLTFGSRW